jgi:hypothetical protein
VGIAVSLIISAVGLILALAVHPTGSRSIDVNAVGWILVALGLIGLVLDLLLWSEWGPGYLRRRRTAVVVDRDAGYPARRLQRGRRTIIEEEDVPPAGPPPGY